MAKIINFTQDLLDEVADEVANTLERGGLVILPTDTVYGLAASVYHSSSVERIFQVKGRDATKAIVVMVGTLEEARALVDEENRWMLERLSAFWPGPLTVVARKSEVEWAHVLAPNRDSLGIRVPGHSLILAVLKRVGPLAVTSANLSGGKSPGSFKEIPEVILRNVDIAVKGDVGLTGIPSSIIRIEREGLGLLREGSISGKDLEEALGIALSTREEGYP